MPNKLDEEINELNRSSQTLFRVFGPVHRKLLGKIGWYDRWHNHPYHKHMHYSVAMLSIVTAFSVVLLSLTSVPFKASASGNLVAVQDSGGATVVNTNGKIYFSTGSYGANVTFDNYSRQFSGFAWSTNMGWIDFGNTGSSPADPVKADRTGHLSGNAKVVTGGFIDFNSTDFGSNVVISGGTMSGYAWNNMFGWINFASVSIPSYNPDLLPPDKPVLTSGQTSGNWFSSSAPTFTWSVPADHATSITPSGVAGYLAYFGSDDTANITLTNSQVTVGANNGSFTWQTGTSFTNAAALTTNTTYYLKVVAVDAVGNASYSATSTDYDLFAYKYDGVAPTAPAYVSASPSGYSQNNDFTFSWPINGASAATDTGGSGLAKYQYKVNDEADWHDVANGTAATSVPLSGVATSGVNTFDLRAVDVAGNASLPQRTNFYFNNSAPLAPTNLTVTPTSSDANSFAFSWTATPGEIDGYYYAINPANGVLTASNVSYTTSTSLAAGPFATQQGVNTFYIVAKDKAGNYNLDACSASGNTDGCAKVTFTTNTSAPGIPTAINAYDISDRNTKDYAVVVRWTAPADEGTGVFAGYDVFRSTDGTNFTDIAPTPSRIYADAGSDTAPLESKKYYYYVKAKDSTGQYSAPSSIVSVTPTGKFTSPPKLVSGPTFTIGPSSITVTWATDRVASSFVQIKDGNTFVSEQGQTDQTTNHVVKVMGLRSLHDYTLIVHSTDVDGNMMSGSELKFTTANTPSVYDLNVSNITQRSAIVNFKSSSIANFTMYYGESVAYGQTVSEISSSDTSNHSLVLTSLKPGVKYFFRVVGTDADGNELRSENSFSTLPMPIISKFGIQPEKDAASTTLDVSWTTNVPTNSTVKYSTDGVTFKEQSSSEMVIDHKIVLPDLADKIKYTIYAAGMDQFGNKAESDKVTFATPNDTRPPKIDNMVIESSNIGNQSPTAQIVVSWKTDEPANSQVEYATGLSGDAYTNKTVLDNTYTNIHLVIISGLDPSRPYHLHVLTADQAGNLTTSGDNTVITGEVSNSALQIILNALQNTFGWMSKLIH